MNFLKKALALTLTLLLSKTFVQCQEKVVDNFVFENDSVAVYFFDPLMALNNLDKNFQDKPDKEKSEALDKFLHENPLYLFKLTNIQTKEITFLCIRGNPEKTGTKMFYKVEVIRNVPAEFNPINNNYSDKVVQVIDQVNCGGVLFENMSLFDDKKNKKYVGNGILFFGYYSRVQPYVEIKASITNIFTQLHNR